MKVSKEYYILKRLHKANVSCLKELLNQQKIYFVTMKIDYDDYNSPLSIFSSSTATMKNQFNLCVSQEMQLFSVEDIMIVLQLRPEGCTPT